MIILIMDLVAFFQLVTADNLSVGEKVLWTLIIFFFPFFGPILFWVLVQSTHPKMKTL